MQGETQALRPDAVSDLGRVFFRPVHWQSAFEETVERLSQAIKLGAVVVGEQLPSERELVSKLEVSRTTLREAIRALQQEGILRTQRGRSGGTFVASDGAEAVAISLWDRKENADTYSRDTYPEVLKTLAKVVEGTPEVENYEVANSTFHKIAARN